jgi:hypothetical protein
VQLSTVFHTCYLAPEDLSYVDRRAQIVCQGHTSAAVSLPCDSAGATFESVLDTAHLSDPMKMRYKRDKSQLLFFFFFSCA